jgi:Predicted transcriptional regulators
MEHTGTVEQMPTNVARQITQQPTSALVPYARNSRTHSAEQVAQIAASIREFGFTNPVLVDAAGGIVAGHGRVMAAQHLGMAEVPTICVGWLSEGGGGVPT